MMSQISNLIILPLGAVLPEHPGFKESLLFQLTGLVVVFIALGLIWVLLEIVGSFFKRRAKRAAQASLAAIPATPAPAATPAVVEAEAEKLAAATAAVIAAAVHVYLNSRHRIDSIVPVETNAIDWAREGRRQIHSARKVR